MPQPVDCTATARAIDLLAADVVALQELDVGCLRSDRLDQPHELARLTGMHVAFAPAIEGIDGDGAYGVALLSRSAITDVAVRHLPDVPGLEPRVSLQCRTGGVTVVVTHLSTRTAIAEMQFAAVARHAMRLASPRVVCGDLNMDVRGTALLAASGLQVAARVRTSPRARPVRQIDFVLHDGAFRTRSFAAPRVAVSDHRPLVVDLEPIDRHIVRGPDAVRSRPA